MSHKPAVRRPYRRSMLAWWRRDPFFMRYMVRELTAFAVLIYAIVLAVGVVRLAQGEAAWNGWLQALRSPPALLLHLVLLVSMAVHAKSWFDIMPKTMPLLFVGGKRLAAATITRSGYAAVVAVTVIVFVCVSWWVR